MCCGRLANRVHDPGSARARHSDVVSLPATIQLTAPLVLSDEGHQGIEHVRHGAGRLPQPAGDGWAPERNPEGSSSSRETSSESSSGTVWRPDKSPARRHPQHLKSVLVNDGDDGASIWSENVQNLLPFCRDILGLRSGFESPVFVPRRAGGAGARAGDA